MITRPQNFDSPLLLPAAFWASLLGMLLERSYILIGLHKMDKPLSHSLGILTNASGRLLLNFAVLALAVLLVCHCVSFLRGGGRLWKIAALAASLAAWSCTALTIVGLIGQPSILLFLASQLLVLASATMFAALVLTQKMSSLRIVLTVTPIVSLAFLQANQIGFFFPQLMPASGGTGLASHLLLTAQCAYLPFVAIAAFAAARWNRRHNMPLFLPLLVGISTLFVAATLIAGTPKTKALLFSMIEGRQVLPYAMVIYPLALSLASFVMALLLAPTAFDTIAHLMRTQSAYSLGFMTIGVFTQATFHQVAFLLIGVVLWIQTVSRWRDL